MSRYRAAAAAFHRALKIDRNSGTALSTLGLAQLFLRQPASAEDNARKSLQLEPDSPRSLYVLGMALIQENRLQEESLSRLVASRSHRARCSRVPSDAAGMMI